MWISAAPGPPIPSPSPDSRLEWKPGIPVAALSDTTSFTDEPSLPPLLPPLIWSPFFFFFFFCLLVFLDRVSLDKVSLCILDCPGTCSVDQAGLEFRDLPATISQVLGLKVCATTAQLFFISIIALFQKYSRNAILQYVTCFVVVEAGLTMYPWLTLS